MQVQCLRTWLKRTGAKQIERPRAGCSTDTKRRNRIANQLYWKLSSNSGFKVQVNTTFYHRNRDFFGFFWGSKEYLKLKTTLATLWNIGENAKFNSVISGGSFFFYVTKGKSISVCGRPLINLRQNTLSCGSTQPPLIRKTYKLKLFILGDSGINSNAKI